MKRVAIVCSAIFFTLSVVNLAGQTAPAPATPAPSIAPKPATLPYSKGDFTLSGTAVMSGTASGHGIMQTSTISGGGLMSLRIFYKRRTALEVNYGLTKSSQVYNDVSGDFSEVQTHIHEITAAYVLRANKGKFRPFAEAGGGVLAFSPISKRLAAYSNNLSFRAVQQTRFSLLYAAGLDIGLTTRIAARIQYRGLLYKAPDFGVSYFNDGALAHINEPSFGFVYRF